MANSTFNNLNQLLKTEIEGVDSTQTGTTKIEGRVVDKNIATVHVNGILAEIEGESYTVNELPLTSGENLITVVATDKAGNSTTKNFAIYYDPKAQSTYQYDKNGNLIQKSEKGIVWSYTWDAENRLIRVTTNNTNDTNKMIEYGYFDNGNRAYKKVISGQLSVVRYYVHDGVHVIAEYSGEGTLIKEYTYSNNIDEVLLTENCKLKTINYLHQDGLNSVVAITDNAGAIVQSYNYEAFGKIINQSGNLENQIAYTGRWLEPETGDYFYRARYYNANSGRFLSEDPIGFLADYNHSRYTGNNPVNDNDPLGLKAGHPFGWPQGSRCFKGDKCLPTIMKTIQWVVVLGLHINNDFILKPLNIPTLNGKQRQTHGQEISELLNGLIRCVDLIPENCKCEKKKKKKEINRNVNNAINNLNSKYHLGIPLAYL